MTDRIKDLQALAGAATQGEWKTRGREGSLFVEAPEPKGRNFGYAVEILGDDDNGYEWRDSDAKFIAAANPQTIKALLDLVVQCEVVLKTCKGDDYEQWHDEDMVEQSLAAIASFRKGE